MRSWLFNILILSIVLFSCKKVDINRKSTNSGLDNTPETGYIISLPDSADENLATHFTKYYNIIAPNGSPIHIISQSEVSNAKMYKVASVLRFYLKDYNSTYGTNKSSIADQMAENKATMLLLNSEETSEKVLDDLKNIDLNYQVLYSEEIMVDGSTEYFTNSYRDATYEEVLHLVQDYGIREAMPDFQDKIGQAADKAQSQGYWLSVMIPEWEREGSIETEYFATVLDVYYGLWQNSSSNVAFDGEYLFNSRDGIEMGDQDGYEILSEDFLPPYLDYQISIHADWHGTLRMRYDTASSYSSRTQYWKDLQFTGSNFAHVIQNEFDNYIIGNAGDNKAVYSGNFSDYNITLGEPIIVEDLVTNRDGLDTLVNFEYLEFADTIIAN